ncbi:hypothetical protein LCGC14_2071810 [marine sediment metagenome]|uniref:Uncharacterized protein n=1 Tax=marine sediment metagenome TaxID=412755 RepID=A0A0F9HF62_9ZZZZ
MNRTRKQFNISWMPERYLAFERLAGELKNEPANVMRKLAEEFLSCWLPDEELVALGMHDYIATRGGGLMRYALDRVEDPARRLVDGLTKGTRRARK